MHIGLDFSFATFCQVLVSFAKKYTSFPKADLGADRVRHLTTRLS